MMVGPFFFSSSFLWLFFSSDFCSSAGGFASVGAILRLPEFHGVSLDQIKQVIIFFLAFSFLFSCVIFFKPSELQAPPKYSLELIPE